MIKVRNLVFSLFFIAIFGALSIFTTNLQADDDAETITTGSEADTTVANLSIDFGIQSGPYWWRRNERRRSYGRPYWRSHPRYYRYGYRNYYPRYRQNPYYYDSYYNYGQGTY